MPTPPFDTAVNPTGQLVMTILTVSALIGVAYGGVRMARSKGTPAPLIMLAGSLLAGCIEPMYCAAFHLWYYRVGQWSIYTVLGQTQPIWSWISYCPFYGGLTLLVWNQLDKGATRREIARIGAVLIVVGIVTEIVCIAAGTYEYYGPHPFRIASFPVWIAVANAVVGVVSGILAARLRPLLPGRQAWAYLALVPVTMTMVQFGTGFLALDVINTPNPPSWLMYLAAIASMGLSGAVAWTALRLVPARRPAGADPTVRALAR
jgi:hypothetical protein